MTDEQIIKALECCATDKTDDCFQCPYDNIVYKPGNGGCVNRCRKDALDLINRKKAEIERLKKENILLLKKKCKDINTARKITKSEAIKEFAERLKEIIYTHENRVDVDGIVLLTRIDNSIDNLVKEMTEE